MVARGITTGIEACSSQRCCRCSLLFTLVPVRRSYAPRQHGVTMRSPQLHAPIVASMSAAASRARFTASPKLDKGQRRSQGRRESDMPGGWPCVGECH